MTWDRGYWFVRIGKSRVSVIRNWTKFFTQYINNFNCYFNLFSIISVAIFLAWNFFNYIVECISLTIIDCCEINRTISFISSCLYKLPLVIVKTKTKLSLSQFFTDQSFLSFDYNIFWTFGTSISRTSFQSKWAIDCSFSWEVCSWPR